MLGFLVQAPFLGERAGQLQDFHGLERFFEDDQPVGGAQLVHHVVPGIIRKSRANNDLKVRVHLPDTGGGFNAVPAGRHAHINKSQRVRAAAAEGGLNQIESFPALIGRIEIEGLA